MNKSFQIVRDGYNRTHARFASWAASVRTRERKAQTEAILSAFPEHSSLLEIGCGNGLLTTKDLAKRFTVLGIDISERQIEAARQNIPNAQFRVSNITETDFPAESFHGVVSFYCFNHIPRSEYDGLFKKIAQWLKPNGLFISSFGVGDCESCLVEDWLGAPTFFSSYPGETTLRLIEESGFSIEKAEVSTGIENDTPIDFLWVFARKSSNKALHPTRLPKRPPRG